MPSARRGKSGGSSASSGKSGPRPDHSPPTPTPYRSLTPRRTLLVLLATIFGLWMGFLVVLYFTTVRAHRQPRPDPSLSAAPPLSAHSTSRAAAPSNGSAASSGAAITRLGAPR
jgi:hypothetical protein